MGFGTELLFMLMLGLVVLGPKRMHAMLGHVARAKAELEKATRGISLSSARSSMPPITTARLRLSTNGSARSESSSHSRSRNSKSAGQAQPGANLS